MPDLVSIIIPVYNVEKYLHRCLTSVIGQTYPNIEIILVDDGSIDNSGMICDRYANKESRIKVIHKQNEGLGYARNSGLEVATGKYVCFCDGDDYIGESHIEKMLSLIYETGTDTCIAGHTRVYKNKVVEHQNVCAGQVYRQNVIAEILPRMCGADSCGNDYMEMSVCMGMLSNEIIRENHLRFLSEREYISEDIVFDFDYYPLTKGVCVSDLVDYYYCDNEGSLTTKYRPDRFVKQIDLYQFLVQKANTLGIGELCRSRLQNTVLAIARYSVKLEYKFEKLNGRVTCGANVKRICCNEDLKGIINEYDDSKIKTSSRIVNLLIEKRNYYLLKLAMKFKNIFGK